MAESEEEWMRRRAYTLWEEEGYPAGKDREHWERAKLEYATRGPTASHDGAADAPRKRASAVKASKEPASKAPTKAPKGVKTAGKPAEAKIDSADGSAEPAAASTKPEKPASAKATSVKATAKAAGAKRVSAKAGPKASAAMLSAVEPAKKRSRKVPAGG